MGALVCLIPDNNKVAGYKLSSVKPHWRLVQGIPVIDQAGFGWSQISSDIMKQTLGLLSQKKATHT